MGFLFRGSTHRNATSQERHVNAPQVVEKTIAQLEQEAEQEIARLQKSVDNAKKAMHAHQEMMRELKAEIMTLEARQDEIIPIIASLKNANSVSGLRKRESELEIIREKIAVKKLQAEQFYDIKEKLHDAVNNAEIKANETIVIIKEAITRAKANESMAKVHEDVNKIMKSLEQSETGILADIKQRSHQAAIKAKVAQDHV
jgi:hypothetical protein